MFNPATPLDSLRYSIHNVDMILLMSVNPGFAGLKFISNTLEKLKQVRAIIDESGLEIRLEVDGGVNLENIGSIAQAGADTFVAGSAVFSAGNDSDPNRYDSVIGQLRTALARARR